MDDEAAALNTEPAVPSGGPPASVVPALAARGVTKRFPGVVANDEVSFEVLPGEVHALLGENGAGKTTLCNVLTGLYRPEEGYVEVGGSPARFRSPRDSFEAGLFMVHQHFTLVQPLTVAENVVLGWSQHKGMWFSPGKVEQEVAAMAERFRMPLEPHARIWQLSVGEQQRVEILKALYRGARILILDEPTSVLTPQEVEQLFGTLKQMTANGATVIFITHKLPEVLAVSDRVTVLRGGKTVGTVRTAETDARSLARMMVGRDIELTRKESKARNTGETVLALSGVSALGDLGTQALDDVSLEVKAGEILAVAGVAGNGQRELAEVIAGERAATTGEVAIAGHGQDGTPWDAIDAGCSSVLRYLVPRRHERVPPIDPVVQGVKPELRLLLRLLAQLLPQKRECRRHRPGVRSGILRIQAVLPSSCSRTYLVRPLRSTGITLLPRYCGPRRLPAGAAQTVMSSRLALGAVPTPPGLPGSSVDPSTRAVPNHPGEPGRCSYPLLPYR